MSAAEIGESAAKLAAGEIAISLPGFVSSRNKYVVLPCIFEHQERACAAEAAGDELRIFSYSNKHPESDMLSPLGYNTSAPLSIIGIEMS